MSREGQGTLYRLHAAHCLQLAQRIDHPEVKLALLDMGRAWLSLAEQHTKNSQQETLVYETPGSRRRVDEQPQPQPQEE